MRKEEVKPNIVTYMSLVSSYFQNEDIVQVTALLEDMEANSIPPDVMFYQRIIQGFLNAGAVKNAKAWADKFNKSNLKADAGLRW